MKVIPRAKLNNVTLTFKIYPISHGKAREFSAHCSCKLRTCNECLVITLLRNDKESAECTGRPERGAGGKATNIKEYVMVVLQREEKRGLKETPEETSRDGLARERMMWEVLTICCERRQTA